MALKAFSSTFSAQAVMKYIGPTIPIPPPEVEAPSGPIVEEALRLSLWKIGNCCLRNKITDKTNDE
jgi:hypothetical protein